MPDLIVASRQPRFPAPDRRRADNFGAIFSYKINLTESPLFVKKCLISKDL